MDRNAETMKVIKLSRPAKEGQRQNQAHRFKTEPGEKSAVTHETAVLKG